MADTLRNSTKFGNIPWIPMDGIQHSVYLLHCAVLYP